MNMQMSELTDDVIASQFSIYKIFEIVIFWLKHVKTCLHIKIYQRKQYSSIYSEWIFGKF